MQPISENSDGKFDRAGIVQAYHAMVHPFYKSIRYHLQLCVYPEAVCQPYHSYSWALRATVNSIVLLLGPFVFLLQVTSAKNIFFNLNNFF